MLLLYILHARVLHKRGPLICVPRTVRCTSDNTRLAGSPFISILTICWTLSHTLLVALGIIYIWKKKKKKREKRDRAKLFYNRIYYFLIAYIRFPFFYLKKENIIIIIIWSHFLNYLYLFLLLLLFCCDNIRMSYWHQHNWGDAQYNLLFQSGSRSRRCCWWRNIICFHKSRVL